MRAFVRRRDTLLTRALLLLLISSAFDVLTMLLIPLVRDSVNDFLADDLFHAWADPDVLIGTTLAGLAVAAYLYLTLPYQPRRARQILGVLVGVLTIMHFVGATWNVVLLTSAIRVASGG